MAGLHQKYLVTKADGSATHGDADYFVLRLDTDPVARIAALRYAHGVYASNPALSKGLREKVTRYRRLERIQRADDISAGRLR